MAKLCGVCGSLCVYFLLFFNINAVFSIKDFYGYSVENPQLDCKNDLSIELIGNLRLIKRDTENNRSNSPPTSRTNLTTENNGSNMTINRTVINSNNNDTLPLNNNKTETVQKISPTKTKLSKTTKISTLMPANSTILPLLGVNGTGQRKIIPTSEPVFPIPLNNTTTQIVRNSNEGADSMDLDEDEQYPLDDEGTDFNKTLSTNNITITRKDSHLYYNSSISINGDLFWIDLNNKTDVKVNDHLAKSHRRAHTVKLSFEFPFYGHLIKNVTIATGGFLYTGDYVHSWLAATQYIAPLMANFDTSISNDSSIRHWDNGSAFTVEWTNVALQDKPNDGEFTFQTTLHKNGDIVFVYKNVPLIIKNIQDDHHPVKVGLSDAYIIDKTIYFVRRKTIYEYHRVNFFKEDIRNWTLIYLKALPTCLQSLDCNKCLTTKIQGFQCQWCAAINRCSNGVDRYRQEWITKNCEKRQIMNDSLCSHVYSWDIFDDNNRTFEHDSNEFMQRIHGTNNPDLNNAKLAGGQPVRMGVSSVMAILFLIAMVAGLGVWITYAYRNPHTTSGQMLIRYRPSQWRWRRGEARYTAATIHM